MRRNTTTIVEVDKRSRLHLSLDTDVFVLAGKLESPTLVGNRFSVRPVRLMQDSHADGLSREAPLQLGILSAGVKRYECPDPGLASMCKLGQHPVLFVGPDPRVTYASTCGSSSRGSSWDQVSVEHRGAPGYLRFNPRSPRNIMVGSSSCSFRGAYDIVFVDYRISSRQKFCDLLPAESLRSLSNTAGLGGDGGVVYSRVSSPLHSLSSSTELVSMSSHVRRVGRRKKGKKVTHVREEFGMVGAKSQKFVPGRR